MSTSSRAASILACLLLGASCGPKATRDWDLPHQSSTEAFSTIASSVPGEWVLAPNQHIGAIAGAPPCIDSLRLSFQIAASTTGTMPVDGALGTGQVAFCGEARDVAVIEAVAYDQETGSTTPDKPAVTLCKWTVALSSAADPPVHWFFSWFPGVDPRFGSEAGQSGLNSPGMAQERLMASFSRSGESVVDGGLTITKQTARVLVYVRRR